MNCHVNEEYFIDYLEGNLEDTKRSELENHLHQCAVCIEELTKLQQIVIDLEIESESIQVPDDFMSNVRNKVSRSQESRRNRYKQRTTIGLIAALFLTFFVGTAVATNSFSSVIDWWKDLSSKQDGQIQGYVQHGLGEELNLTSESNGVKVTITSVVADDIQTLIYYEIEDQSKEHNYMINYSEGLKINNQEQYWDSEDLPSHSPVMNHFSLYSKNDHAFKGRIGIAPMSVDKGTIHLELSKLEKVIMTSEEKESPPSLLSGTKEFFAGEWNFDIPVKKYPSIVHDLQVETKIDGNPVIFDKLTIAPTITVLSYRYRNDNPDRRMDYIKISSLESKGKHVYDELGFGGYGGSGGYAAGWSSAEATFESLYFEQPKDVRIHIGSATFSIEEKAKFAFDISKGWPQTFEYLGTKITIDQLEVGNQTKIRMTEELHPKRIYEMLDYHLYGKDGEGSASSASLDGYYVDKDGKKFKVSENFYRLNDLKNPRLFTTEHKIELSNVPVGIEIEGYRVTTFYDKAVTISLD